MNKKLIALPLTLLSFTVLAEPVFYGEVLLGTAKQETTAPSIPDNSDRDTAFGIRAGYNLYKNLALELAYQDYGKAKDSYVDALNDTISNEFETSAWTVATKGTLPLNQQFALVGRLGVAFWDYEIKQVDSSTPNISSQSDDSGSDLFYGVGIEYHMNQFYLGLEYSSVKFDVASSSLVDGMENKADAWLFSAGYKF